MNEQPELPLSACLFLILVGAGADATKFGLEFLFGAGLILDPLFITPVTSLIFWVVHQHNGVPMYTGKRAASAWINLAVSATPGLDALPDWTTYAIYLTVMPRITKGATEVLSQ